MQIVTELYQNGKATLGKLKLESSPAAKKHNPVRLRHVDWLLLSSVKPKYDHPSEQFDGITLPGKLKKWFVEAGYSSVEDYTNLVFKKDIKTLLKAQNDYKSGYSICLFVDADVFLPYKHKTGSSFFPNHWVVMNSDIRIRKYNTKTKILNAPITINQIIVKKILNQIQEMEDQAEFDEVDDYTIETDDRILLDAFTWGVPKVPVASKVSSTQDARLSYFLNGFYGYLKVKR